MRRGPLLAALAASAACTTPAERTLVVDRIPPDLTLAAALGVDDTGAIVGATGLAPIEDGRVIAFAELPGAVAYEVVGYTPAALAAVAPLPAEPLLRTSRLAAAAPDDTQLPAPSWHVAFDDTGAQTAAPPPTRALTATWLPPCPFHVPATNGLAMSCLFRDCPVTIAQTGCRFHLDTSPCSEAGLGNLDGDIGARGEITIERASHFTQCEATRPAPEGVALSMTCTENDGKKCVIEAHTSSAPPPLTVDEVHLVGAPRPVDPNAPRDRIPPIAYVSGLALLDRVALVARDDGGPWSSTDCPPERAGVIDRVDLETLAVTTSTAPRCIIRLARRPGGDEAVFLTGDTIGVIDASGRVRAQHDLAAVVRPVDHRPIQLLATDDELWVVFSHPVGDVGATVARLDPDLTRLTVISTAVDTEQRIETISTDLDGTVVVVGNGRDDLEPLTTDGRLGPKRALFDLCSRGFRIRPTAVLANASSRTLVIAGIDNQSLTTYVLASDDTCQGVMYPWAVANAYALVAWPPDPDRVLVGLLMGGDGSVALLDPRNRRFVGGHRALGPGPIDSPGVDRAGRIWALQPWTGTLLRMTPAR